MAEQEISREQRIILALARARGGLGFNMDDVARVLAWADQVDRNSAMLDLAIRGFVGIDLDSDGQVIVSNGVKKTPR